MFRQDGTLVINNNSPLIYVTYLVGNFASLESYSYMRIEGEKFIKREFYRWESSSAI